MGGTPNTRCINTHTRQSTHFSRYRRCSLYRMSCLVHPGIQPPSDDDESRWRRHRIAYQQPQMPSPSHLPHRAKAERPQLGRATAVLDHGPQATAVGGGPRQTLPWPWYLVDGRRQHMTGHVDWAEDLFALCLFARVELAAWLWLYCFCFWPPVWRCVAMEDGRAWSCRLPRRGGWPD